MTIRHRQAIDIHYTTVGLAHHGFPTWHISSTLVHALLRTTVPAEWPVARFKMPFPAIRFILEKGSFVLNDGSEVIALQAYLIEPPDLVRLPENVADELSTLDRNPFVNQEPHLAELAARAKIAVPKLQQLSAGTRPELILVAWQTPAAPAKSRFTVLHGWFDTTLGEVVNSQLIPEENDSGIAYRYRQTADQKRAIVDNMLPLFLNAVLLLTAKPEYIEGGEIARPARTKGKRTLESLYHPRFLGKKFAYKHGSATDCTLPGRNRLPPGWRAGHWKAIAYGRDHGFHRHDWIQPYQYGIDGHETNGRSPALNGANGVTPATATSQSHCSHHVGQPGDTLTLMLTLRKISPTPDNRGRQYIFEDAAGNILTTIANQRLDFKLNAAAMVQTTIVRHYMGGKECRTEIADCRKSPN